MEQQDAFGWKKPIVEEQYFYGRGIETREILRHLSSNQSVFLLGASKIGKTSLVLHLLREYVQQLQGMIPKRHIFIHIDFNDPHYQTPNNFWAAVIGEIGLILDAQRRKEEQPEKQMDRKKIEDVIDTTTMEQEVVEEAKGGKKTVGYSLEELSSFLEDATKKHQITIVMDNFECLKNKNGLGVNFYNTLKQLVSQIRNFSYLVVSSKGFSQLYQENNDFQIADISGIFTTITLGLLKKREAMAFLKQENSSSIDMDGRVAEWGYVVTGGHPYLLQAIGYQLNSASVVTIEQLMACRDEIMSKAIEGCSGFFMYLLENLSIEEREGLLAIIRFKPIGKMVDLLEKKSLIKDRRTQRVFSELFDRFLHEFWGDLAESNPAKVQTQARQKVFLSGLVIFLFSIFLGTFAFLSSILVLGTFLFGIGILSFLVVVMFFKDESYQPQEMVRS
ncbi:MAG: hypothetical protein ABH886_03735 [Candidatus Desantisbacteria bacterium]